MENQLKFEPSDFLHTRLADIFSLSNDYSNALMHYNAALSINNEYERAIDGIMRVEKLMSQSSNESDPNRSGFQSLNIRMMDQDS